jgi:general stress protein 26
MDSIIHKIKSTIQSNNYMTLASVDTDNIPLATPVFFANDENYMEFYWISSTTSNHSQNIHHNSTVSIVIFDSTVKHGDGFGVYMLGSVNTVLDEEEIKTIDELLRIKCNSDEMRAPDYYLEPNLRRIYKFIRNKIWINTKGIINLQFIDQRHNIINF